MSSLPVAARSGRCWRMETQLIWERWPEISPTVLPLSAVMQWPKRSLPSPTAMMRCESPSQATSLILPAMIWYSPAPQQR